MTALVARSRTPLRALGVLLLALALLGSFAGLASGEAPDDPATNAVVAWNANAGRAALAACIAPLDDPLHESRLYAMTHLAMHDALNAIDRRSQPYAYDASAPGGATAEAAVAAAARDVLVAGLGQLPPPFSQECVDGGIASAEADYTAALSAIPDGRAKADGIAAGRAAASAILARRAGDGSDTLLLDFDYPQGSAPGEYRFTPDRPFAFAPRWGEVTPFVLKDSAQYRPGRPYDVTTRRYANDLREVQALGGDGQVTPSARTADQTQIAHFWVESSPLAWNRIGRSVATAQELDLWDSARLFGLLNMALADGYIASFDTKYYYDYWRPVTAIREAATDGNPRTTADPTWTPLVTTPPIPEYDSAHAVQGGAAAAVFRRFFGTDRVAFSACSLTLPEGGTCDDPSPTLRSFRSFSQAASENATSRIYVGFHFRDAVETGLRHGRDIGNATVRQLLRPI